MALGLALALGACSAQSDEDMLENTIRDGLSGQGNVQKVELTKQANGNLTGFAIIREPNGRVGRLNCTARSTAFSATAGGTVIDTGAKFKTPLIPAAAS